MKLSQAERIVEQAALQSLDLLAHGGGRDAEHVIAYLTGGPGIGKTTVVQSLARKMGMDCFILSLAQYDPGELGGWPVPSKDGDSMVRMRPDWMPTSGRGFLFLDELPQAPVACQNIAAQIVNERRVGPHRLPKGWVMVAAGNRMADKAGTSTMPTHLRDRLMEVEIEADMEDTVSYFNSVGVDERVCAYLRFRPEFLHKFDKDVHACPSPRSWERVGSILKWKLDAVCMANSIHGQVGKAAGNDFLGFLRVYSQVPDIDKLLADPMGAPVPQAADVLYATAAALSRRANEKTIEAVLTYMTRIPKQEMAAFVVRDAVSRDPGLKSSNALRKWVQENGKLLVN